MGVFITNTKWRVGEMLDALEADYKLRQVKSLRQVQSHLKPLRQVLSGIRAQDVSTEMADNYVEKRLAAGRARATTNRETQLLAQAFRLAIERKKLKTAPIIRRLSEKDNVRTGFFEKPDFEALVRHLPDYLQDFARFGYLVGWRRGEISSLLWSDLDMDARSIILRGTEAKNGHPEKCLRRENWRNSCRAAGPPGSINIPAEPRSSRNMCSTEMVVRSETSEKHGRQQPRLPGWKEKSSTTSDALRAVICDEAGFPRKSSWRSWGTAQRACS